MALAVWYLDDSTKRQGYDGCRLATQSFPVEEVELLRYCLDKNYNLRTRVYKWNPSKGFGPIYRISSPSGFSGYQAFRSLVYDFLRDEVPSMLYKLE